MSDLQVIVQLTPNPSALKFVMNRDVIIEGKVTYFSLNECNSPLAAYLFAIDGVKQVHFFDNTITVTKSSEVRWIDIEEKIMDTLYDKMDEHNPNIEQKEEQIKERAKLDKSNLPEELREIDALLDESIRPALQGDGGDVDIVDFSDNVLTISYQGACHSCPSASLGTLQYIQMVVGDKYPNVEVVLDESGWY
ncbi:NifU family protein [bacterium]|nr:NifU family protein [bacterium]